MWDRNEGKGSEARYFHKEEELSGDSYERRVSYLNRHSTYRFVAVIQGRSQEFSNGGGGGGPKSSRCDLSSHRPQTNPTSCQSDLADASSHALQIALGL